MSFGAPDPESFKGMEEMYSYVAPEAAVAIALPSFTFGPAATQMARIIYMNQCNPGQIMKVGAIWLQLAEKYLTARDQLDEEVSGIDPESWEGDDCDAFVEQAGKVGNQLMMIALFAIEVGVSLMAIAALLTVMVTVMAAFATALMAMAVAYWPMQAFPPTAPAAATLRAAGMTVAATGLGILQSLDTAVTGLAKGLAAAIGAGMGLSWIGLATQGNVVDPRDMVGPTAFNFANGFAQLALRNALAPAGGRHVAGGLGHAFVGGQGAYNLGNNYNQNENVEDGTDWRADTGIDPGNLDFIPNDSDSSDDSLPGFDTPDGAKDQEPNWSGS